MAEQTEHNHVKKIQAMAASGERSISPGGLQKISVAHDDWFSIFDGGYCNCDPDVRVKWMQSAAQRSSYELRQNPVGLGQLLLAFDAGRMSAGCLPGEGRSKGAGHREAP